MKKTSWRVFIFLAAFLILNIGIALSIPEGRVWFQAYFEKYQSKDREGFISRIYYDETGEEHRYSVFIPYGLKPEDQPPLIIYLNGLGENGNAGLKPFKNGLGPAIWEMKKRFPFIALFPQCPEGKTWQDDSVVHRMMKLLNQTIEEYHADPDRISVTGISHGGNGAWEFAMRYPDRFAAVLPVSSDYNQNDAISVAKNNVPIWNLYVQGDKNDLVETNRDIFHELLKSGFSPQFTELNGTLSNKWNTHDSWGFTYRNHAIYDWLLNQNIKQKQDQNNPFRLIFNEKNLSEWEIESGNWKVNSQGILSCQRKEKTAIQQLYYDNKYFEYDLHLEFKMTNKDECGIVFHGENKKGHNLKLKIISPDFGSGGIIEQSNNNYLQSADSMSQRSFVPDDWNDLRIKVKQDQIKISLNGWELHDFKSTLIQNLSGAFSLIASSTDSSPVQWRYIRLRDNK